MISKTSPSHMAAQTPSRTISTKTTIFEMPPKVDLVGDVMLDAVMYYRKFARKPPFSLSEKFIIATIHRAENTDTPSRLKSIFNGLYKISKELPIFLPLHPRTKKILEALDLKTNLHTNIKIIEPLSYLEMIYMLGKCTMVMTDSGGLQKEAFFFEKPCITLREETEWVELIDNGFNYLAGADSRNIIMLSQKALNTKLKFSKKFYGKGNAGNQIVSILLSK